MTQHEWSPELSTPFVRLWGVEELIPRVSGWSEASIRMWCDEIVDFVPGVAKPLSFPALSPTTFLPKDQNPKLTTFSMRHADLAAPEILEVSPISLLNLVANYSGIVAVGAYDMSALLCGAGVRPQPLPDKNHRRVEAFITDPEVGESSDWHVDERLTLPLYVQDGQALLISHLTNARTVEDILESPFTLIEPAVGQFVAFDGVRHPHKGLTHKQFKGDRIALGILYDLPGVKVVGPQLDDLIAYTN